MTVCCPLGILLKGGGGGVGGVVVGGVGKAQVDFTEIQNNKLKLQVSMQSQLIHLSVVGYLFCD